ncbi:hypothetical protein SprV_0501895800 [Sparganum proliferum]
MDEARVCVVCGEPASGYNFDRLTCESCKAFFRRNALKPRDKIKACGRSGDCNIEGSQRKHCPSCRLEKCLAVGMKKELILRRLVSGEVFTVGRVGLQTLQRSLQSVLITTDLTPSGGTYGDISMERSFGKPLVVHTHEVAAPTQLQLSQHGVDAEDSRPFQYIRVRYSVLPSQIQYPSKTSEVEMIESSRLLLVHRPGPRSTQQRRQVDRLVHPQFGV